ncbi:hypothetical protein VKT23_001619 [Stygiomarasmius scandens]|uniref:Uncharacterized protein n=1 Tax=Marasmiellus scandens TaxID=2682957 RepID=A0ABR1K1I3_9AGAR
MKSTGGLGALIATHVSSFLLFREATIYAAGLPATSWRKLQNQRSPWTMTSDMKSPVFFLLFFLFLCRALPFFQRRHTPNSVITSTNQGSISLSSGDGISFLEPLMSSALPLSSDIGSGEASIQGTDPELISVPDNTEPIQFHNSPALEGYSIMSNGSSRIIILNAPPPVGDSSAASSDACLLAFLIVILVAILVSLFNMLRHTEHPRQNRK